VALTRPFRARLQMSFLFPAGLILILASWLVAWSDIPIATEYSFVPLWLGYISLINGISELMTKTSLIRKMETSFLILFAISIPFWWLFEFLNSIVQNWRYIVPYPMSSFELNVRASISFSTVIPAVLSTIFLFYRVAAAHQFVIQTQSFRVRRRRLFISMLVGAISLYLLVRIPHIAFPLVWIAPILLLEPVLYSFNYPSLLREAEGGEWSSIVAVMTGTLFTGFWWEVWNLQSSPKWIYTIPYLGFWKIFEMPILGYLGYPLFGLIVYSYTMFVLSGVLGKQTAQNLIFFNQRANSLVSQDESVMVAPERSERRQSLADQ
jgi:hypothetical protein